MNQEELKKKIEGTLFKVNAKPLYMGIGLSILTILLSAILPPNNILLAFALTPILIIIIAIFSRLLKAPTPEGRKILDQIEGFK